MEEGVKLKRVYKNPEDFMAIKNVLVEKKFNFDYEFSGNVESIQWNGLQYVCLSDRAGMIRRGHHLNSIFKKDIDFWLSKNKNTMPEYNRNYIEHLFNLEAIKNNIGKDCRAIDLNDCYWRMAHKLGYSSEKTFIKGLRKKDWKIGRNACIGSLYKTKMKIPYIAGEPNYNAVVPTRSPKEYEQIRHHIIGEVYKMFMELYKEIGENFYMYMTDCVYTTEELQPFVTEFFNKKGFPCKSKSIYFVKVFDDPKVRKIYWYDYSAEKKDEYGRPTGKKGDYKHYCYSDRQLIQNALLYLNGNKPLENNNNFLTQNN